MSNNKGFSLIEIMISLVVLLVIFMGLMQGALVAIDSNMRDNLREEAISIANTQMLTARDMSFAALLAGTFSIPPINKNFRNMPPFPFTATREVNDLDANNKEVIITVSWTWKGPVYSHSVASIVRNPAA